MTYKSLNINGYLIDTRLDGTRAIIKVSKLINSKLYTLEFVIQNELPAFLTVIDSLSQLNDTTFISAI